MTRPAALLCLLVACAATAAEPPVGPTRALYLANEGVLVGRGPLKVAFDPLFRYEEGYYASVPEEMEQAMFRGEPPFDGLTAVFVSHFHRDHFSPELILRLLRAQNRVRLYAPEQAVRAIRDVAVGVNASVFRRVHPIALTYGDEPLELTLDGVRIEAVRIPHSGWPDRVTDVENLAFRVTLDGAATVLHLGDADVDPAHFDHHPDFWARRATDMAFPPYWFFLSERGLRVLEARIRPTATVGIHLPTDLSDAPPGLFEFDLFTKPGETREIPPGE